MNRAEITARLLALVRDEAIARPDRARGAGALIEVLRARIRQGRALLSQPHDQSLVIDALGRLRELESLLSEVLKLEVELNVDPVWLQNFGGRISAVWPIEKANDWWSGASQRTRQEEYFRELRAERGITRMQDGESAASRIDT